MFAPRRDRPPDRVQDGIEVWIDVGPDSQYVVVRLTDDKREKWHLVETHSGPNGGEFRIERKREHG